MGIPYSAPGLTTGATYSYRVRAYNGSGVSAWSEATGTVWRNIPLAPVQLRAIPITSSQILLVWKDIANENLYRLEAKPEGGAFAEIAQTRADVTTFAHNGLDAGATWIYRVRASNEAGATPTKRAAPPFRPCRRRPRA